MPPRVQSEVVFPLPQGYRSLPRRRRLLIEVSAGVILLAFIVLGASLQMPVWVRLIGWALMIGCLMGESVLVVQRWKRRRGWRK